MVSTTALLVALVSSAYGAPLDQPTIQGITYGGSEPVPHLSQWLPPSTSYSSGPYKQAIYLSFDGMHQFDLTNYISKYPNSTFAEVVKTAVVYCNARTSSPSDSLPATASLFTGAYPRDNGIFWETVWDRSLYAGGSNCKGSPGALCDFSEADDLDSSILNGGGAFNLSVLPMQKTIWGTCDIIYPHDFLRTNTIFEVGRANGLVTAYADKHSSYELLNGPSGIGLSQGYFPEIASVDGTLKAQEAWDDLHCSSLIPPFTTELTTHRVRPQELDLRQLGQRHQKPRRSPQPHRRQLPSHNLGPTNRRLPQRPRDAQREPRSRLPRRR